MKFWRRKNFLSYLLLPISGLYRLGMAARRYWYQYGFKKVSYFPVPVIIVGNITVGGTGKTPLVICLAHYLREQGWKPGIVSRGYTGKNTHSPQCVYETSDPRLVGDEAVLIAKKTACPMVVCRDRVAAVSMLLRDHNCNIVVSDDGLQHLALGRDIEIAVIDGELRFGNGHCLPAGPLREPVKNLKTVDFIVNNGGSVCGEWEMTLKADKVYAVANPSQALPVTAFQGQTVHAVAAIGNPSRFFRLLENLGMHCIPHAFPDHYFFRAQDLDFERDALVIMTEKDAVKCQKFTDKRLWCLSVTAQLSMQFFQILCVNINSRRNHAHIQPQFRSQL